MSKIRITSMIFSCLLFAGCFWSYDIYGFKPAEKKFDWGVAGAKLIGTELKEGNKVVKRSPYELFLWFGSDSFLEGKVSIKEIKLTNNNSGNDVFLKSNITPKQIEKKAKIFRAYFSFEDIKLPYEDMNLQIKFLLEQKKGSKEYKVILFLKTDHQKFRRIVGV